MSAAAAKENSACVLEIVHLNGEAANMNGEIINSSE